MKILNCKIKVVKHGYIIYVRKSSESEDRQMESIPAQLSILKQLARDKNLKIVNILKESQSAKEPGRPKFNRLIELIDSNPDIKGIITWKLNRLFRNPEDEGKIRQRLADGRIEEIITPNKIFREIDSDFTMAVEGAQAQRFIRDLREDTERGVNRKIEKGMAPILAPVGYFNNTSKRQGEKDISPHPIYFPLVRKLFELSLTGNYSISELSIKANELGIRSNRGGKLISKSQMYKILSNPFYTGKFIYRGELYQGSHKPMITNEEFDLIQDIIAKRSKPRKQKHDLWFTGIPIICGECFCHITGDVKIKHYKNGKTQHFVYARCTKKGKHKCTQAHIQEKELETQVVEILNTLKISSSFVDWANKWLKKANERQSDMRKVKYEALKIAYEGSQRKLDNLLDLKLDGLISDNEYLRKKAELEKSRDIAQNALHKLDKHSDEWADLTLETFNLAANASERFKNANNNERKSIIRAVGSNLILKDKKLTFEARTPFYIIQQALINIDNFEWLEPEKKTLKYGNYEVF